MARITWPRGSYGPMEEFGKLQDEINKLFDFSDFPASRGLFDRTVSPALDMVEQENEYVVYCDLPGIRKEDLEVFVAAGVLTIKGEKKAAERSEKAKVYREETWAGRFQRTLSLPGEVDADKVGADYTDGVLTVTLPKREEAKPRQIAVKAK